MSSDSLSCVEANGQSLQKETASNKTTIQARVVGIIHTREEVGKGR